MSKRGENIYKRKDGRWEGRYHKGRQTNGQLRYGYIYGKSYTEVKQKLYVLKAKYHEICTNHGDGAIDFAEWVEIWLKESNARLKSSTFFSYSYKIKKYVSPYISEMLNECSKETIERLIETLRKKGLFPSTIQVVFRIVKKCFQHAVDQGLLEKNPCFNVKLPKNEHRPIRALTRQEQKQLEKAALTDSSKRSLPVLLALRTGLRIGEIAALKWENIDFAQRFITVNQTLQRVQSVENGTSKIEISTPKTTTSMRRIPMGEKITRLLRDFKSKSGATGFVFTTNKKPVEPRLISYHFHHLLKQIGLKNIHFHQLRHTFATRCLEANGDVVSVSALLGHSSAKMTLDTYADSMIEQRVKVMRALDRLV